MGFYIKMLVQSQELNTEQWAIGDEMTNSQITMTKVKNCLFQPPFFLDHWCLVILFLKDCVSFTVHIDGNKIAFFYLPFQDHECQQILDLFLDEPL